MTLHGEKEGGTSLMSVHVSASNRLNVGMSRTSRYSQNTTVLSLILDGETVKNTKMVIINVNKYVQLI